MDRERGGAACSESNLSKPHCVNRRQRMAHAEPAIAPVLADPQAPVVEPKARRSPASYLWPAGNISLDELITAWMLRAKSTAPVTSMSRAVRA